MSIERTPLLLVSTANIPRSDAAILERLAVDGQGSFPAINGGLCAHTSHGFLLWIGDEGPKAESDYAEALREYGFSEAFGAVLEAVHKDAGGFCYLMLDGDCEPIEGLPTFEW